MARSLRLAIAVGVLAALIVGTGTVVADGGRGKILDTRLVGVPNPPVTIVGVNGAGAAWTTDGSRAKLFADGRLDVEIEHLVFLSGANAGKNTVPQGRVAVVCNGTVRVNSEPIAFSVPLQTTATDPAEPLFFSALGAGQEDQVLDLHVDLVGEQPAAIGGPRGAGAVDPDDGHGWVRNADEPRVEGSFRAAVGDDRAGSEVRAATHRPRSRDVGFEPFGHYLRDAMELPSVPGRYVIGGRDGFLRAVRTPCPVIPHHRVDRRIDRR